MNIKNHPLYGVYQDAKRRCTNSTRGDYIHYGGRGIQFKFESFQEFVEELGDRPEGFTLDRINNNGHYEVGNVRWASRKKQVTNQRIRSNNKSGICGVNLKKVTVDGIKYTYWSSSAMINGKRKDLYVGNDFFEACCRRKVSELCWEQLI